MFALWERYRARHTEHTASFRARVLAYYRGMTLPHGRERKEFPTGIADADVIRQVEKVEIAVCRQETPEWGVQRFLAAYFDVAWGRGHLNWLLYDPESDSFGDWM
jgi:hypothetical protein